MKEFSLTGYPNFKSWEDNSFALSCTGYRYPDHLSNYKYNDEGDGIYKVFQFKIILIYYILSNKVWNQCLLVLNILWNGWGRWLLYWNY